MQSFKTSHQCQRILALPQPCHPDYNGLETVLSSVAIVSLMDLWHSTLLIVVARPTRRRKKPRIRFLAEYTAAPVESAIHGTKLARDHYQDHRHRPVCPTTDVGGWEQQLAIHTVLHPLIDGATPRMWTKTMEVQWS